MKHTCYPLVSDRLRACEPPTRSTEIADLSEATAWPPPPFGTERHRSLGHTEDDIAFFQAHQPVAGSPPKDGRESRSLGGRIRAVPKQCWFNARRAVMRLSDYAGASYVEGWAVLDSGLMIEHGWVVRDGALIDPTLPTGVDAYFPGLEFRGRREIGDFLSTPRGKTCKRSPFFFAYGWGGGFSPTMRRALSDATEHAVRRFLPVGCHAPTTDYPQSPRTVEEADGSD